MKIRTFLKHTLVIAGLLLATFQASAQAPAGGGGGARGNMGILTQEQRTKMREAIATEMTPLTEKLVAAQKEAAKAALADNATEAAVRAKVEAVHKIQTDMAVLRLKGLKAIASTLTAEQKTQLENARDGGYNALLGAFGGMGMGGGGRAGGGGGGGGTRN